MQDTKIISRIRRKYRALSVEMDERARRQRAATEASELGWGGVIAVARATDLSRTTITAGLRELALTAKQRSVEGARVHGRAADANRWPKRIPNCSPPWKG